MGVATDVAHRVAVDNNKRISTAWRSEGHAQNRRRLMSTQSPSGGIMSFSRTIFTPPRRASALPAALVAASLLTAGSALVWLSAAQAQQPAVPKSPPAAQIQKSEPALAPP